MTDIDRLTATEFQEGGGAADWRALGAGASAWFDVPSQSAGAALLRRIAEARDGGLPNGDRPDVGQPDVDLRPGGVRVRIGGAGTVELAEADVELARALSAQARDLGLSADPATLQSVRLAIDAIDRPSVMAFWRTVLGYRPVGDDCLADPSRRDPVISFRRQDERRPLRNRMHVDVVRPPEAVAAAKAAVGREAYGAYGLTLADPEGNEVDLVGGDELSAEPNTTDWRAVFSAMAFYPTTDAGLAAGFATAVAGLSADAGVPLLIDLRPDGVTVDSGKDLWEDDFQPAGTRFADLADRIQRAARDRGLVGDVRRLRFLQLGIDAVDVPAVRAFWIGALGYRPDPRPQVTDIYDPRRFGPVIIFQDLDASDVARREQPDRIHLELVVPSDRARARTDAALAAGGRIVADEEPGRCTVADPEGNRLDIVGDR